RLYLPSRSRGRYGVALPHTEKERLTPPQPVLRRTTAIQQPSGKSPKPTSLLTRLCTGCVTRLSNSIARRVEPRNGPSPYKVFGDPMSAQPHDRRAMEPIRTT